MQFRQLRIEVKIDTVQQLIVLGYEVPHSSELGRMTLPPAPLAPPTPPLLPFLDELLGLLHREALRERSRVVSRLGRVLS